jgi:hypothetical protein
MFGLATDDSHNYHVFGSAYSNAGRGWVMVRAESLKADVLVRALEAGEFYATTGVILEEISFKKNVLRVRVAKQNGVSYRIEFIGATRGSAESQVLRTSGGIEGSFAVLPEHLFVRVRIVSDKLKENPFQSGDFEMAWSQPVTFR